MSVVVGIDLSLASTGIARIDTAWGTTTVDRIVSKGKKDACLFDRYTRLDRIACQAAKLAEDADLVVIEGPSFGQSRQGGEHDRAGLWWMVAQLILCFPTPLVEVPPATLKKYATGKGNAPKDAVLAAVVRRYPDVDVAGNDQADALVLAAMGARRLGEPIEASLPIAHLDAMTKVAWPELEQVTA